jgi:hypothetical protein
METSPRRSALTLLADHDVEGQVILLWGTLAAEGWLSLLPLQLVTFKDVGLPYDSHDRAVWRFSQARQMILITGNRSMQEPDSLEQTIREENTPSSLPVVTIATVSRLDERPYRERCARRLVEIVIYKERYLGAGRLFIP